jgi:hypothetical protein
MLLPEKPVLLPKTNVFVVKNNKNMFSALLDDKYHVSSFLTKAPAYKCSLFLSDFKHRYGKFPDPISMHKETKKPPLERMELKPVVPSKRTPAIEIFSNEISIEEVEIDELNSLCSLNRIGILGITDFEYSFDANKININFKATEYYTDADKITINDYIVYMNTLLLI